MASRTFAADDFKTIKAELDRIRSLEMTGKAAAAPASPASPLPKPRAADDYAEIAKNKRAAGANTDIAYPKDKPASLDVSGAWPGPTQYTRMSGSPVAKRGVTFG